MGKILFLLTGLALSQLCLCIVVADLAVRVL
jgi:hypothetical protein